MRIGYIWTGNERWREHGQPRPGSMHMNALPAVLESCDVLECIDGVWTASDEYDLIVVQHFTRDYSVLAPIRERFPTAQLAIRPDRPPEFEARWQGANLRWLLRDLALADVVLDAMPDGRRARFYAQLAGKPWAALPTPVVPHPDVDALRTRERYGIVGWLHPSDTDHHLPTLAALAGIQRQTSIAVTVVNATDADRDAVRLLGLEAACIPAPPHEAFIDLLSRARLVVDLFPMHTPGRVATLSAYLGTPTITGLDTQDVGHVQVDVWDAVAAPVAIDLLTNRKMEKRIILAGIEYAERVHSPAAIRQAVEALIT